MEENLLIEKPQVFVYKLPVRSEDQVAFLHRAADWDTSHPVWYGKLFIYVQPERCLVELRHQHGGIYGEATIKEFPGKGLAQVLDSSRYFALKIRNGDGNFEMVGIGFASRSDSADVRTAIENYFNMINNNNKRGVFGDVIFQTEINKEVTPAKRIKAHIVPGDNEGISLLEAEGQVTEGGINIKTESPSGEEASLHSSANTENQSETKKYCFHPGASKRQQRPESTSKWNLTNFFKILKCRSCSRECECRDDMIQHFQEAHAAKIDYSLSENPLGIENGGNVSGANCSNYKMSENPFLCPVCKDNFQEPSEIMEHLSSSHGLHVIDICEYGLPFVSKRKLEHHNREYHPNSVLCLVCWKRLPSRRTADEHMLTVHLCDPSGKSIHCHHGEFWCERCGGWYCFKAHKWMHCRHPGEIEKKRTKKLKLKPAQTISKQRAPLKGAAAEDTGETDVLEGAEANFGGASCPNDQADVPMFKCPVCEKAFRAEYSMLDHLKSSRHRGLFEKVLGNDSLTKPEDATSDSEISSKSKRLCSGTKLK